MPQMKIIIALKLSQQPKIIYTYIHVATVPFLHAGKSLTLLSFLIVLPISSLSPMQASMNKYVVHAS